MIEDVQDYLESQDPTEGTNLYIKVKTLQRLRTIRTRINGVKHDI